MESTQQNELIAKQIDTEKIIFFQLCMDITVKDLELLVNDQNKLNYDTLYQLIINEFENALRDTDIKSLTEEKIKTMGTCGIYLSSIVELLYTTRDLMQKGFIESGGTVAATLWERTLTLRKILIDPQINSEIHVKHIKAKETPWRTWKMVEDVINDEHRKKPKKDKNTEAKLFYLQYTFLCNIKHGNPFTISYLNRPERSSVEALFKIKPNDSYNDKDLKTYIMLLVSDNALDALIDYTRLYRTTTINVDALRSFADQVRSTVPLNVPKIFLTTPEEMGKEFWEHLIKIDKRTNPN